MKKIGLEKAYIKIEKSAPNNTSCGGNQELFKNTEMAYVVNQGCGLIAVLDTVLYLSGTNKITFDEYNSLVKKFISSYPLAKYFMQEFKIKNKTTAVGILPSQICKHLNVNTPLHFKWNGLCGHKDMYEKIKRMLERDIPVIWAIYSPKGKLAFYRFDEKKDSYIEASRVNNHYITAIGIIEKLDKSGKLLRMIEISSWGKRYFINYDEYLGFVGHSVIARYCSNIVYAK